MGSDHYFSASPASAENLRRIRVHARRSRCRGDDGRRGVQPRPRRLGHRRAPRQHSSAAARRATCSISGSGWGPIALSLAIESPHATVWAVDVNERALDLVRRNADALGLDNINAVLPDDVPDDVVVPHASARIRRSASARTSCTACSSAGSRGWTSARMPGSSCSATSARTRCSAGSRRPSTTGYSVHRAATGRGFRVLKVRRHGSPPSERDRPAADAAVATEAQASATSPE